MVAGDRHFADSLDCRSQAWHHLRAQKVGPSWLKADLERCRRQLTCLGGYVSRLRYGAVQT
eukprot:5713635-Pleurochrysis_carterae.AAC.2